MASFNYQAWSYEMESKIRAKMARLHRKFEDTFFTEEEMGEALTAVGMPVVEMTPNYAIANIAMGAIRGTDVKGNPMGLTDYAMNAVDIIPWTKVLK